ncbi:MAG TPA: ATP-binding cassette domain-containing protein, partial [Bdellovibrionota bacterium]|nr:ATP-binding cassette domain-containing protein [Bdellovibrionota bacterium]
MIRLTNVGKNFDGQWIFRGLNVEISAGESVAFVGPSGGGKSVLMKIMAGLFPPDEGTVEIATEDRGMLFQKNALFDSFTVIENLLFPLRERKGMEGP